MISAVAMPAVPQVSHSQRDNVSAESDWSELRKSMEKTHVDLAPIEPSGNSDVDLFRLMLPHHQAAIDMVPSVLAQNTPDSSSWVSNPLAKENAEQVAKILGISQLVSNARLIHTQTPCESTATVEELSMRQDILETVVAASFEVDGVLAELDNERAQLSELRAALQARRDRAVNLTNVANLITGTGLGIAVNAMQFSSSTANVGNGLGVGSGISSTVLSIIGIRQQRGPQRSVGRIPNMLAPLFARQAALNSYYPQPVLEYLRSVPPGEGVDSGSRL